MKKALVLLSIIFFFPVVLGLYEGSTQIYLEDEVIRQGGLLEFIVEVDKKTGTATDTNIEYWIESSEGEKWGYGSTSIYMEKAPSEVNVSLDAYVFSSQPAGTYYLRTVVDMGEFYPTLSQSKQILVLAREISAIGSVLKITKYPMEINGESGWSNLHTITIQNQGDEILPNVTFTLTGVPETWYIISPQIYYKVQLGAELLFSVRIDVPSEAPSLDYNLTYRVFSTTSAYDQKGSVLRVFASTYSLVSNELQKVEQDRDALASGIQDRQLIGYNITTAWLLLSHVDTQLRFAKEYITGQNYDNALVALSSAQTLIEQGIVSLETAAVLPIAPGLTDWRVIIFVILLIPISLVLYHYWSQRRLARILSYYSGEVMENLKDSMPGAKLRFNKKMSTILLEDVKGKMDKQSGEGMRKKLTRTKKLLRMIEKQYSTGSISKESYLEIKKGLQSKIDILEKKLVDKK